MAGNLKTKCLNPLVSEKRKGNSTSEGQAREKEEGGVGHRRAVTRASHAEYLMSPVLSSTRVLNKQTLQEDSEQINDRPGMGNQACLIPQSTLPQNSMYLKC